MLKKGDQIPSVKIKLLTNGEVSDIDTANFFKDKKIVLFAVPGAFTSVCTKNHIPGYVTHADTFKSKGVDAVVCLAVNDASILKVWGDSVNAHPHIQFLSDGNAALTKAMGMEIDLNDFGMGLRSQRYAALVENGVVKSIQIEDAPVSCSVSTAESVLEILD